MKKYLNIIKTGITRLFLVLIFTFIMSAGAFAQEYKPEITAPSDNTQVVVPQVKVPFPDDSDSPKTGGASSSDVSVNASSEKSPISGGGTPAKYNSHIGGAGCSNAANPFETIACKAMKTLTDLKVLIYILSGFGLIVFTWGAIFGKINWNHLASLGIGLFLVTMTVPFIAMFVSDGGAINNFERWGDQISGSEYLARSQGLMKNGGGGGNGGMSPGDASGTGNDIEVVPKEKYKLKDLLGSGRAAVQTVREATAAVDTAKKQTKIIVEGLKTAVEAIKDIDLTDMESIQYNSNKLAGAATNVAYAGSTLGNSLQYSVSHAMDAANDIGKTDQGREDNAQARLDGYQTNKISAAIRGQNTGVSRGSDLQYRDAKGEVLDYVEKDGKVVDKDGKVVGVLNSRGVLMTESKTAGIVKDATTYAKRAKQVSSHVSEAARGADVVKSGADSMGISGGLGGTLASLVDVGMVVGAVAKNQDDMKLQDEREMAIIHKKEAAIAESRKNIAKQAEEKATKAAANKSRQEESYANWEQQRAKSTAKKEAEATAAQIRYDQIKADQAEILATGKLSTKPKQ